MPGFTAARQHQISRGRSIFHAASAYSGNLVVAVRVAESATQSSEGQLGPRPASSVRAQRKVGLKLPCNAPLNGRSDEIRCAAKCGSLRMQGNSTNCIDFQLVHYPIHWGQKKRRNHPSFSSPRLHLKDSETRFNLSPTLKKLVQLASNDASTFSKQRSLLALLLGQFTQVNLTFFLKRSERVLNVKKSCAT
jgi:hypothetical protein